MTPRPERMTPEKASALAQSDKRRIIVMTVGVVLLAGAYFWAQTQRANYEEVAFEAPTANEIPVARVPIPEFDVTEVLEEIRDATEQERLIAEPAALNAVFDYGRLFTEQHYEAMDVRTLDSAAIADLRADPAAHRVDAFRARGELLALRRRQRPESRPEELIGTIALRGGDVAHFVVLPGDEDPALGSWVRIDGVFLKLFRSEGPSQWWDGPLICGASLKPSWAPVDLSKPIPLDALAKIRDDSLEETTGIPDDAKWELMARALAEAEGLAPEPIDWSTVPLLDDQMVGEIFVNGEAHRGKPFRFEILRNLDGHTLAVDENPLRIEKLTEGWIASQTWKGPARAINYISPFDKPVLSTRYGTAKFVTGHGFFMKNRSYETKTGNLGRVPFFVLAAIDPFVPPEDTRTTTLMVGVFVATALLSLLLFFLLVRDKKRSQALQEELIRRRRARRQQRTATAES